MHIPLQGMLTILVCWLDGKFCNHSCRYFIEGSFLPPDLVQHLKVQAGSHGNGLQAAKRRSTLLPAPSSGAVLCPAAAPEAKVAVAEDADQPDRWDLGVVALLQGKALEAEKQHHQQTAALASAAAACAPIHVRMRLPHSAATAQQPQPHLRSGVSAGPATGDRHPFVGHSNSGSMSSGSGPALQHQESNCSSRSRSSFVGSVASYQQQRGVAQHQAQLLSCASLGELQACRMWAMLRQWEDLRGLMSQ